MRSWSPTIAWVTRVGRGGAVACNSNATTTVASAMGFNPVAEAATLLSVPDKRVASRLASALLDLVGSTCPDRRMLVQ